MTASEKAHVFLREQEMHPELLNIDEVKFAFAAAMDAGLRGEPSSLGMFPAYLSDQGQPKYGKVLVIDAGGTNLRIARLRYGEEGLVIEQVERSPMPGTSGEKMGRDEFFEALAARLLPLLDDCDRGCFCFSYPCEILPDGDGRVVRLTKELKIEGLPGSRLCAPLEEALVRLGAKGQRVWHVINDTVSTKLSLAAAGNSQPAYDDTVGFILGTGANICCSVPCRSITKSPDAAAMDGDMIVNLESGGFDGFPRGKADRLLDENSDAPGQQLGEKIISGAYFPALLRCTLQLAVSEGLLSESSGNAVLSMADVGELCGETVPAPLNGADEEELKFIRTTTALLLERGAKLLCAELAAIIESRRLPSGSRVCVCADGTTFEKNPLLKPYTEDYLLKYVTERSGITVDFFQTRDATLLGTACAGLMD